MPILVVDDKPANLLSLEAVLASPEHELVEARSGKSALQLLEERDFAVVLLDVEMPGMDGLETAAEMRRLERGRHVPVIFVSGVDTDRLHVQRAYAGGAVDFIQKPFEPDVIRAKVSAFAELYRARQRIAAQQTEAVLAASYRALIDNLPELAWTARPDGFIDFYNRRWYEYTGATAEEMRGWGWKAVHHPDTIDAVVERWTRSIDTGEPFEMEFPLRGADGVFRWFLTRIVPLSGSDGAIVRWFGTNTNIDEYRRLRDALASSVENERQARLEAEAARRHVEELRDQAVTAVQKREQLLAVVSHDLRNPLSTVLLGAKQIERSADESVSGLRTKKAARSILNAVSRMTRLVGDLLDLAKLEAGRPLPVDLEIHDVTALARQAAEQLEPVASSRRLTLATELADPAYALCDDERMQQVLSNLIGNAIKFTREGGAIGVSVRKEGGEVILSVSDTGVGIPTEQLPYLFTPYWLADVRRKDSAGLGLAIVKALAETHGARLWADTAVGKGSTFYFALPAADPIPEATGER